MSRSKTTSPVYSLYRWGHGFSVEAGVFFVLSLVGVMVSYWRVTKRGEDFARAVYDVFLANLGIVK